MGRTITFSFPPKRIISLVPSQTEFLYHLGLADEVVGQTLFCVHPVQMHEIKPRVGGTKRYKFDKIAELKPDLIIGNKEENNREEIEKLAQVYPVWMSDIETLDDAMKMMQQLGGLVDKEQEAIATIEEIRTQFAGLAQTTTKKTTAYLIWRNPWMAAGHHTFINDMLNRIGFENVFQNRDSRYPQISNEELSHAKPGLILLSSEPYPFKEEHIEELRLLCPQSQIMLVDGELFSWYGSRLLHTVDYFKQLLAQING